MDYSNGLECTHCGVSMTPQQTHGSRVRYFRCPSCHRWVSSVYAEIIGADAKFKAAQTDQAREQAAQFEQVKTRLERWLASLDERDPYRVLGVSPLDSNERVRSRFRELAMHEHPDRGGSGDRMRELNSAYERIQAHRGKQGQGLASRASGSVPALVSAASASR